MTNDAKIDRLLLCLQFLLTVGTVVLGLFVASRVLGIEAGSGAIRPKGKKKGERWGSGRCVLHSHMMNLSTSLLLLHLCLLCIANISWGHWLCCDSVKCHGEQNE